MNAEGTVAEVLAGAARFAVVCGDAEDVWPTIAADACARLGIPFVIYPHGSDIEYTVRLDERYLALARVALADCAGIITGSREMSGKSMLRYFAPLTKYLKKETKGQKCGW